MESLPASSIAGDSKQLELIVTSVILMVASLVGISLRLYTRLAVLRKIFAEDVLIVLGTFTAFGLSITYTITAYRGFGKHNTEIPLDDAQFLHNASFPILLLYILTALLVKTSFLVLYLRLDQRRPMRWAFYTLMFAVIVLNTCFVVIHIFLCVPPRLGWAPLVDSGAHCWAEGTVQLFYNTVGIITIILDTAIFAVPLFMLHSMDLPTRQKYAVGALFAVGFLPIIAGCLRCFYVWNIVLSEDISYDGVNAGIWAQVELHLAILCGSASTFKALLRDFFPTCCRSGDGSEDPFPELQSRGAVNRPPTPWTEDDKFKPSPNVSGISWRTCSHTNILELPQQDDVGPLRPHRVVLTRKPSSVALMPADLQLRFPTIESRLAGRNAVMEEAGRVSPEGRQWSLV